MRAQEAREERKAQEERENGVKAQEEQKKEVSAQGEQENHSREGKAHGERREREVVAQEGHDGEEEMATQEKCVEAKKEANSMHEENDVSNRHMTWWRDAWWVRMDNGPHFRTVRGRRRVWRAATRAAREARETERIVGGEGEMGARDNEEKRKQHLTRCLPLSHHSSGSTRSRHDAAPVTRRPQAPSS